MSDTFSHLLDLTIASEACWGQSRSFVEHFGREPLLSTDDWAANSQAKQKIAAAENSYRALCEAVDEWSESNSNRSLEFVNQAVGIKLDPYFINGESFQTAHEASVMFATAVLHKWRCPDVLGNLDERRQWLNRLAESLKELPQFPDPAARLQGEHYAASDLTTCADEQPLPPYAELEPVDDPPPKVGRQPVDPRLDEMINAHKISKPNIDKWELSQMPDIREYLKESGNPMGKIEASQNRLKSSRAYRKKSKK